MRDPVETNTTVSAFVESSYTLHVAQVVDPHDVIPHETPHEILLIHEICMVFQPLISPAREIQRPPPQNRSPRAPSFACRLSTYIAVVTKLMSMLKKTMAALDAHNLSCTSTTKSSPEKLQHPVTLTHSLITSQKPHTSMLLFFCQGSPKRKQFRPCHV